MHGGLRLFHRGIGIEQLVQRAEGQEQRHQREANEKADEETEQGIDHVTSQSASMGAMR